MSAYVDMETAQALALAGKALIDLEIALDKIKGYDLEGEREAVQGMATAGLILTANNEPYAVVRMEDVWVECDVLTVEEQAVIKKAQEMLVWPGRFVQKESTTEG